MLLNLIGIFCRTGGQTKMEVNQLRKEMLSEVFHFIFIDAKLTPISLEVPLIMKGLTPSSWLSPRLHAVLAVCMEVGLQSQFATSLKHEWTIHAVFWRCLRTRQSNVAPSSAVSKNVCACVFIESWPPNCHDSRFGGKSIYRIFPCTWTSCPFLKK